MSDEIEIEFAPHLPTVYLPGWAPIDLTSPEYARPSESPVIAGLIYRAKRHVVSGPPEAAKTLLGFIAGLEQMRAGGSFVHVDFEMGPEATRLLLAELGATLDEIRAVRHYEPDGPPDSEAIETICALPDPLLLIDAAAGAYDASALDDNSRRDAERFAATWIWPFWQRRITTLTIDHVVKNPEGRGKYAIGSERKTGGADVHLGLEAITQLSRGTTGVVRVTTHKDRPGHLPRPTAAELELRSDPDTHAITWDFRPPAGTSAGEGWRPTILMDRVLEHVGHHDYEPAVRTTLARSVRGNYAYVLQAIDVLLDEGRLALDNKRVVNVPRTFLERSQTEERSSFLSLQEEQFSGTVLEDS